MIVETKEELQEIEINGIRVMMYSIDYLQRIKHLYGFIYVTTNLVNGKMYVGQRKMSYGWKSYLGSGKSFKKALEKYGRENFERKIIDVAFNINELNYLENVYTRIFNAVDSDEWYNLCHGGIHGEYNVTNKVMEAAKQKGLKRRKEVRVYSLDGRLLYIFNGVKEAAQSLNIKVSGIKNCCNHIVQTNYGYIFRYGDDPVNIDIHNYSMKSIN